MTQPPQPRPPPRHLGLPRRQSYDPLSISRGGSLTHSMSLGTLPSPTFGPWGSGQRSVPAIEVNRLMGSSNGSSGSDGHRGGGGMSSPTEPREIPRTPGGSLVIGAEIFGFGSRNGAGGIGSSSMKTSTGDKGRDRWGSGKVDVDDEDEDDDVHGVPLDKKSELTPLKSFDTTHTSWPTDFEKRLLVGGVSSGEFQLRLDSALGGLPVKNEVRSAGQLTGPRDPRPPVYGKMTMLSAVPANFRTNIQEQRSRSPQSPYEESASLRKNLSTEGSHVLSYDFNITKFPRPSLRSTGSSADLRSPETEDKVGREKFSMTPTSLLRPSSERTRSGLASDASSSRFETKHVEHSKYVPPGASEPPSDSYAYATESIPSSQPQRNSAIYTNPGLHQNRSTSTNRDGRAYPDVVGDLAAGLENVNLRNGAYGLQPQQSITISHDRRSPSALSEHTPQDGGALRGLPPSAQYAPYYSHLQVATPYLSRIDPYSPYADSQTAYLTPQGHSGFDNVVPRRDSGYASFTGMQQSVDTRGAAHLGGNIGGQGPAWANGSQPLQPGSAQLDSRHPTYAFRSSTAPYGPGNKGVQTLGPGPPGSAGGPTFSHQQQQHNFLGRGMSSAVEYIAPGPHSGNMGFGVEHSVGTTGRQFSEDMTRSMRSPALEEFRTNRHRSWELSDLAGHIVEFSGDQLGSRHIQTKLETASSEEKELVFDEILPNLIQLSTDVFANYVIQKLFEQCSQVQKSAMARVLEGHILQLSLQMYGCRVIQKALEYVLVDQQVKLIQELDGHILKCARDAQSNHVVQRALECMPGNKLLFITDACLGQVYSLATHPYGCRVLQRIFENCAPQQSKVLLDELHRSTRTVIQDQYGNYVVQWIIEKGQIHDRSLVISNVYGHVLALAQQKFASNVVEKCIVNATDEQRFRLIEEVLTPAADGSSVVKAMLLHPYANYVMQRMLHTAAGSQREALFAQTSVQLANLRKFSTSYSKHLITIEKLLNAERIRIGH